MIRLALRVPREHADVVLAELLELVPAGVEEREDGDVVEYAVYGALAELPDPAVLHAAAGDVALEIATTEVADDWAQRWWALQVPVVVEGEHSIAFDRLWGHRLRMLTAMAFCGSSSRRVVSV